MYYIGIDVGGTNIKAGLVDKEGHILLRETVPTLAARCGREVAEDIGKIALSIYEKAGEKQGKICSIGIGIPGACAEKTGTVSTANIDFLDFPLREAVQKYVSLPVRLANDANCAALGEYAFLSEKPENMLLVTLGTGIGGGIIIGGKLYAGAYGNAGEIGHNRLIPGGELCGCGRRGCWEMYGSVSALVRQTAAFIEENPASRVAEACEGNPALATGRTAFSLMKEGDADGAKIVDTWISYVADGLCDLVNILEPSLVLIGGAISREGEALLSPLREKVCRGRFQTGAPAPAICAAAKGNDAGLIGAAFLGVFK